MKNILFAFYFVFLFLSCSSDADDNLSSTPNQVTPQNIAIELEVLDNSNLPIENAEVKIYSSESNYNNDSNVIETLFTDSNGMVSFSNLTPQQYFWKITKTCYINNNSNSTPSNYNYSTNNSFQIIMDDYNYGNLEINNTSNVDIRVNYYREGIFVSYIDVSSYSQDVVEELEAGTYSTYIENLSTLNPIPQIPGSMNISCSSNGLVAVGGSY